MKVLNLGRLDVMALACCVSMPEMIAFSKFALAASIFKFTYTMMPRDHSKGCVHGDS